MENISKKFFISAQFFITNHLSYNIWTSYRHFISTPEISLLIFRVSEKIEIQGHLSKHEIEILYAFTNSATDSISEKCKVIEKDNTLFINSLMSFVLKAKR